ncbi:MAG: type II secretion system protein [Candidatus Gastranaerophilaceae bacterium]|jgi:prepilin-type N-terminal cleavage/methylation domain-containing protein
MNKAFSLIEILISVAVMGIITLSMANFSSNIFNISYNNTEALTVVNQTRQLSALLSNEINRSSYIFPSGINLTLTSNSDTTTINTTNAVAFLVSDNNSSPKYFLKVFYIDNNDIYFFTSTNSVTWPTNTLPATYFSTSTGNTGVVLSNIDSSTLTYTLSATNGITDTVLKGTIGGASEISSNALIRAVTWNLSIQDQIYYAGGISQNVPR